MYRGSSGLHARQPCVAVRQLWEDQRITNICFQCLSHLAHRLATAYSTRRQLAIICEKSIGFGGGGDEPPCWVAADVGWQVITVSHYPRQETSPVSRLSPLSPLSCHTYSQGALQRKSWSSSFPLNNLELFCHSMLCESIINNSLQYKTKIFHSSSYCWFHSWIVKVLMFHSHYSVVPSNPTKDWLRNGNIFVLLLFLNKNIIVNIKFIFPDNLHTYKWEDVC